jgi:hypothetical protein
MIKVEYTKFEFNEPKAIDREYYKTLKDGKIGYKHFFLVFWHAEQIAILGILLGSLLILVGSVSDEIWSIDVSGWFIFIGLIVLSAMMIRVGFSFNSYLYYTIAKSKFENTILKAIAQSKSYEDFLEKN